MPSKVKVRRLLTTPTCKQMLSDIVRRKGSASDPVKDANRGLSKTAGHGILVAPASRRPGTHSRFEPSAKDVTGVTIEAFFLTQLSVPGSRFNKKARPRGDRPAVFLAI